MNRCGRRVIAVVVATVVLLVVAGCGIPTDEQPRAIPDDAIPEAAREGVPGATASTNAPNASTQTEQLYLVRTGETGQVGGERLQPVPVEIQSPNDPDDLPRVVIDALIELNPTESGQSGLVNAVPTGTRVLSARVADDEVLDLDLTNLEDVDSSQLRLAVAQIVFSATGITALPVRGVRFFIDGEPAAVPTEAGTSGTGEVITRSSFPRLDEQVRTGEAGTGTG